jgi:hypothetical protein
MDQNQEDLGPAGVWQIREFPKGLREYLADEARRENIVVGELLTRIVLAYRSGSLGKVAQTTPQNGFSNVSNGGHSKDALDRAIDRACRLADHAQAMPKGVAALAFSLVKGELQALKPPSTKVLKSRLTHQPAEDGNPSESRAGKAEIGAVLGLEHSNVNELENPT